MSRLLDECCSRPEMNRLLKSRLSRVHAILAVYAVTLILALPVRSDDLQSKVDQYLKGKVTTGQFSGQVLVARGDHVIMRGDYGLAGRKPDGLTNNQRFRFPVGAVAEQFVAVALLQLAEQGKLKIDAPICNYLPNCPSDWKDIQVVHLLTHTSGLPALKHPFPDQVNSPPRTLHELLTATAGQPVQFKPGSRFEYNKLDFAVLCLAIESASGRTSKEYIETEVFHALKMSDTAFLSTTLESTSAKALIGPQDRVPGKGSNRAGQGSQLCDDRSYSTVDDLHRFDRAVEKGTIISHESQLQMFTPYRDGHGLGWKINKEFDRRLALQNGSSDGASVSIRLYPDDDILVILVADSSDIDSAQLTHDIGAIVFGKNYPVSTSIGISSTWIRNH